MSSSRLVALRGYLTGSASSTLMPFGYYLENRQQFLQAIDMRTRAARTRTHEDKLIALIKEEHTSSSKAPDERLSLDQMTMKTMMAAGVHYGHACSKLHPHMSPLIAGVHSGIHIINLEKTIPMLRQACRAISELAAKGARIVFVGTRPIAQRLTYECAMACEQYYVNVRWLGGTITNREHVIGRRDVMPDLVVILDYPNNRAAVKEANKANIPTMGICDTDCDPDVVTYPIAANDDCIASVELIGRTLAQAAYEGRQRRERGPHDAIVKSAENFIAEHAPQRNPMYSDPKA